MRKWVYISISTILHKNLYIIFVISSKCLALMIRYSTQAINFSIELYEFLNIFYILLPKAGWMEGVFHSLLSIFKINHILRHIF